MLKWFLRAFATLTLLVVAIFGWIVGSAYFAGRSDPDEVAYLKQNATALDLKATDGGFRFPAEVYQKRLFLLGEVHGIAAGQTLDLALLQHLNARTGLRTYLAEIDPAQAAAFNGYLQSGDEAELNRVFAFWAKTKQQWGNDNFRRKIIAIRTLNQQLEPSRRIRFLGMDRLQDVALACDHLAALAKRAEASQWQGVAALRAAIAQKRACEDATKTGPLTTAGPALAALLPTSRPDGIDAQDWTEIVAMIHMLHDRHKLSGREDVITAGFDRLVDDPDYANEKLYGLWGMYHVMQKSVNGLSPFAQRLRNGKYVGQLVSIAAFNLDSAMMLPEDALPIVQKGKGGYGTVPYSVDNPVMSTLSGIGSLKSALTGEATLFAMNASGSPYLQSTRLGRLYGIFGYAQKFEVGATPGDRYAAADYAVVVTGSAATEPFIP